MEASSGFKSAAEIVASAGGCEEFLRLHGTIENDRLRDTFAMIALAGILHQAAGFHFTQDPETCYQIADAMLRARRK